MDLKNLENIKILWCHWDLFRFFTEEHLNNGIVGLCSYETMKDTKKQVILDYRIYMYKENDKFIVDVYKDEDNKDSFQFNTYNDAHEFMDTLDCIHPEYLERPARIIDYQNGNIEII